MSIEDNVDFYYFDYWKYFLVVDFYYFELIFWELFKNIFVFGHAAGLFEVGSNCFVICFLFKNFFLTDLKSRDVGFVNYLCIAQWIINVLVIAF